MANNYLIESADSLSLQKERESLIKENHFLDASLSFYDLEETLLENALEDLDTYGLLSSKKIIIIQGIETIKYDDFSKDFDHLFHYLENSNPDNLLIIESHKLNNTLKVVKQLKKLCTYIEPLFDSIPYIKSSLDGFKLENGVVSLLDEYCLKDLTKIDNECEKLKNYKWDEKFITKQDVLDLVVKKLGDPRDVTFAFTRALASRERKEALLKYHELLSYQMEPFGIIGLLESQMRIIYQVMILEKQHLSDKEIASSLQEKSDYRIRKTRELTRFYTEEEVLMFMQKIADMDYQLKTSDVDANHLIEMLILSV